MKKYLIFVAVAAMMGCSNSETTYNTYYIDANGGDDTNDGLSPDKAWRTLANANEMGELKAGEKLLLKRGGVYEGQLYLRATGTEDSPISLSAYGEGALPHIQASDTMKYAVRITDPAFFTISDIEISNLGTERLAGRHGLIVETDTVPVCKNVTIERLYIHDVNGTLPKGSGEGCGILVRKLNGKNDSHFYGMRIENNVIRRCERNGMNWSGSWKRQENWAPHVNTLVRYNLLEEVPGDGIVPIGCDSTIIEYNVMRNCTSIMPDGDASAGIWPWSCDNTTIQFNEVSQHHAPWDGQGFDSDYNCNNTIIQYNYSHDNDGGFLLICTPRFGENTYNIGNRGTRIQYNVSSNDGLRTYPTRDGMFSPIIHVAGPCQDVEIWRNVLAVYAKPSPEVDTDMITFSQWDEYCDDECTISDNIFYSEPASAINMRKAKGNTIIGNYYLGNMKPSPLDKEAKTKLPNLPSATPDAMQLLIGQIVKPIMKIGNGETEIVTVDSAAIHKLFLE